MTPPSRPSTTSPRHDERTADADRPSSRGAQARTDVTRTVFVSVLAKDGSPITDLTASEFSVREGDSLQAIASATLATMPLRVHIVSDGGSAPFSLESFD